MPGRPILGTQRRKKDAIKPASGKMVLGTAMARKTNARVDDTKEPVASKLNGNDYDLTQKVNDTLM